MSRSTRSRGGPEKLDQSKIPKELRDFNTPGRLEGENETREDGTAVALEPEEQGRDDELRPEALDAVAEDRAPEPAEQGQEAENEPVVTTPESSDEEDQDLPEDDGMAAMQEQFAQVLAALADNKKTVVTANETKPPQFEGVKDARAAEHWLMKLDSLAQQNDWSDKKYIEVASNAMVKEAENWMQAERFKNAYDKSESLKTKANFREAFLKMFRTKVSAAEQILAWNQLKQKSDESVRSFWIRVETTNTEFVKHYLTRKGWNVEDQEAEVTNPPPAPAPAEADADADARAAAEAAAQEARQAAELQRQRRQEAGAVMMFANSALRDMFFINGLRTNIGEKLKPRLNELMKMEYSLLDAALEAEAAVMKTTVNSIDGAVAAFNYSRGNGQQRGRGGARGGRGGRGGGQGQRGNPQQQGNGENKLKKIQSRQTPLYCSRCCQWGKHWTNECRRPANQIASLEIMDRSERPAEVYDDFYDNLKEMPAKPPKEEQGN